MARFSYREAREGRRFILRIPPRTKLMEQIQLFAKKVGLKHGVVVSATHAADAAAGEGRAPRCGVPCTRAGPAWTDADSVELERDSVSGAAAATP